MVSQVPEAGQPPRNARMLSWAAVCLLSVSWYPLTAIYLPTNIHYTPPLWFGLCAILAAFFCFLPDARNFRYSLTTFGCVAWLLSAAFFSLLIPFPYNVGALFIGAGAAIYTLLLIPKLGRFSSYSRSASLSLTLCGLVLAVQSAILPFFHLFASRFHKFDLLAPVMSLLLNLAGMRTVSESGELFTQSSTGVLAFITSWEGLGLYVMVNLAVGGYVLLYSASATKRQYFLLPIVLLVYMLLRYAGVLLAFMELEKASVFWRVDLLVVSLLPLPWFLAKSVPLSIGAEAFQQASNSGLGIKGNLAYYLSVAVGIISCVGFFGFVDPGEKKQGRILIDEGHSNWEWTMEKFDKTTYGERTTYNYWCLAQYLGYFYRVEKKREPLTDDFLSNYDILFIKTPTEPFSDGEISTIKKFVDRGGGLILVGDHTNVFGITTNLNPVASQFGMAFRYDAQYDLNGELSLYMKPVVLAHPIVQHMPKFMFETSCMLDAPLMAENVIVGYGIKSVYADYSRPNFFPKNAGNTERMEYGLFVQAAGVAYGKGRVFLFSDSTPWSNFSMFIPGKPELLLGAIEWLNRRNGFLTILRTIFLALAGFALASSVFFATRAARGKLIGGTVAIGLVVTPVAVLAFEQLNRNFYPVPQPHTNFVKVSFETEHSNIELPVLHLTQRPEKSYHTFFVWIQRLDLVPRLSSTFDDAVSQGGVAVIINPVKPFSGEEARLTKEFLDKGGKLLLLDDPECTNHTIANELFSMLHQSIRMTKSSSGAITVLRGKLDTLELKSTSAGMINGGKPVLYARGRARLQDEMPRGLPYSGLGHLEPEDGILRYHQPLQENADMRNRPPLPSHAGSLRGQNLGWPRTNTDTVSLRPIASVQQVGKGSIAAMACSYLFTDREMGYTTMKPNENQRKIDELEYWIFEEVLGLRKMP